MVVHACDPNYLGFRDGEDRVQGQVGQKDPISTNKLDIVVCTCGPSYKLAQGKNMRTLTKKKKKKSGRAPA
jgi:hypothetical protein